MAFALRYWNREANINTELKSVCNPLNNCNLHLSLFKGESIHCFEGIKSLLGCTVWAAVFCSGYFDSAVQATGDKDSWCPPFPGCLHVFSKFWFTYEFLLEFICQEDEKARQINSSRYKTFLKRKCLFFLSVSHLSKPIDFSAFWGNKIQSIKIS